MAKERLFEESSIKEALKDRVVVLETDHPPSLAIVRISPLSEFGGNWAVWYGMFLKTAVPAMSDEEASWLAEGKFQVDAFLARCAKEGGRKVWAE
jgi:hypothetical protein